MRYIFYLIVVISLILSLSFCSGRDENNRRGHSETVSSKQADSIDAYLLLTSAMFRKDMDSAWRMLNNAEKMLKGKQLQRCELNFLNIKGNYFWFNGSYDSSLSYYHKTLNISEKNNFPEMQLKAASNLGALFNLLGQNDSAGKYLAQSLVLAKAMDKKESIAKVSYDLGNLYRNANEYPKALQNLFVALNYWEIANDSANLILVNYSLGATYQQMGNTAKSLLYSEFAMKLALKVNKADYLPEIYNNLGILYWKNIGNPDSTRYFMALALEKSILLADPSKAVITLTNLGGIESSCRNHKKALAYYLQALNLQKKGANLNTESGLFINIGEVYHQLKIDDSARYYNEKGLEIARKINAKEWMRNAYYNLFTIDSAHRNFDSALLNYRQFEAITDSITSKETEQEIADLTLKYETDKKEKTIQFLEAEQELKINQLKNEKLLKNLFFVLLCGAVISIIAILFERRGKNLAYKMLVKKNIELTDFEEELLSILAFACQQSDQLSNLRIVARYSASPLSDSQKYNLIFAVMDLFDSGKTYLQPDITLDLLAEKLNVSRNYLSQVINEKFHQNFSDFINELRIKEARKLLMDKKNSNLTIQAIANSVGFNSMSSFISAFKKYTGVKPSVFLKSNIEAQ